MLNPDELRQVYGSPSRISALLEAEDWGMQKKFGQNFLLDELVRKRIVDAVQLEDQGTAWEIGPGLGALTFIAVQRCTKLGVFEIDHGFAEFLRNQYAGLTVYEGDFLKTWSHALTQGGRPTRVFGNLPYNAASAIIAVMLENSIHPGIMVFTVQREAAERMCALPGSKNYSAFSVLCASLYQSRIAFDLAPDRFWPQPRVRSSVVVMKELEAPCAHAGEPAFTRFTRDCFMSRRKMLRNNLRQAGYADALIEAACKAAGIAPEVRAESLAVEAFHKLYEALMHAQGR